MPSLDLDGTTLHYLDSGGSGPALLLLHAFPLCARMWEPQLRSLGGTYRIIAPDLEGFGGSTVLDDPASYSMERWADQAKGLLDALGLREAVVGGLSMGGYVALAFHRRHRAAVRGLILADTRADADSAETRASREALQKGIREKGPGELVELMLGRLLSSGHRDLSDRARQLMDNPPAGMIGGLEAMKVRPDFTPDLAGIEVPTLVIGGTEDVVTPPAVLRALHERIPGSRLDLLPGAGHLANLEEPVAFDRALASFLGAIQA